MSTETKLKQLKAADLKEILQKASVTLPARINKADLVAKILATPAAVDIFNKQIAPNGTSDKQLPPSQPSNSSVDNDLLAPPEQFDWESTTESTTAKPAPITSEVSVPAKSATVAAAIPAEKPAATQPSAPAPITSTTVTTTKADDESDKRKKRAERFGVPLVEPKQKVVPTPKATQTAPETTAKDTNKLEARAARFGVPVAQAGQKRGRSPAPVDKEEEEKRKKRAERFGNTGAKA